MVEVVLRVSASPHGENGFKFFWAKTVVGFDPSTHCMECLIGSRIPKVTHHLAAGGKIIFEARPGEVIYLCGVANPYIWNRNFHLPFRVSLGAKAERPMWTGQTVEILNAEQVPFGDAVAREKWGHKGKAYVTCRNFQFGAHLYPDAAEGHRAKAPRRKPPKKSNPRLPGLAPTGEKISYPSITVVLIGEDANPKQLLARAIAAARAGGLVEGEIERFREEARAGGLGRLVSTIKRWFTTT